MQLVELVVLVYFCYVVAYSAVFCFGAFFYRTGTIPAAQSLNKFCVLIPAYKEDGVIVNTTASALAQRYPRSCFDVVVICDGLQPSTLSALEQTGAQTVKVSFESSTKVKSLREAMTKLSDHYHYAVILDADNIMEAGFLEKMNALLTLKKYRAVQGQRKPKNTDSSLALLDGLSEAINNHIYRQGASALNLSASINGSGVVFDYRVFKEKINTMHSVGGFDRELEVLLLREGIPVYYYKDAIVYDEKVANTSAFKNQRKRWISSQYYYLRKYFTTGVRALIKGNVALFNSAVLRNIQMPRLLNLGFLFVLTIGLFPLWDRLWVNYLWWPVLLATNSLVILLSIPRSYFTHRLVVAALKLPFLFGNMALLLFKSRGANRKFLHTPHNVNAIRDGK